MVEKNGWAVVYKRAEYEDGSLLFPERLSREFLDRAKKIMGSYVYSNQYLNEVIPSDKQTFKKAWIRYYDFIPERVHNYAFIDPAISEADTADYTGVVVISVDCLQNWYVRHAGRYRLNPSQIIELCFRIHEKFPCMSIGVEDVAFQRAILHFAVEEMRRRKIMLPITGVKRGPTKTKEMRILGLVPRFEWGSLFLTQGMHDLEGELAKFPRGQYDDILDALASLEEIVYYPSEERKSNEPPAPNSPEYESWYIKQLIRRQSNGESNDGSDEG